MIIKDTQIKNNMLFLITTLTHLIVSDDKHNVGYSSIFKSCQSNSVSCDF